jgi:hypothetical protein
MKFLLRISLEQQVRRRGYHEGYYPYLQAQPHYHQIEYTFHLVYEHFFLVRTMIALTTSERLQAYLVELL